MLESVHENKQKMCQNPPTPGIMSFGIFNRICPGLRQITTNPILEADNSLNASANTFPIYKKYYRVRIDEPKLCTTKGLCINSNSETFIIDNVNNRLKKLNMLSKVDGYCSLPKPPLDVCVVDDCTVLVSFGDTIVIVNIKGTFNLEKELRLKKPCLSIAWYDDEIYYTDRQALFKCNKNGENNRDRLVVSKDRMKIYIAAVANGLITIDTRHTKRSIFTCGQLTECTDICLVNNESLLVSDYESHAVYLVDGEGEKLLKTVAEKSNGLLLPRPIDVDETDSTLLEGCLGRDFISVFEIEFEI